MKSGRGSQTKEQIYSIVLQAITGKREARTANLELRYGEVEIKKPKNSKDLTAPKKIRLFAIDVIEVGYKGKQNDKPIHWRLLTTHIIDSVELAMKIVHWYSMRWQIEQLFRTLKKQGLNNEASLLESYDRLKKIAVLALIAAVKVMQLTLARNKNNTIPITTVFDESDFKYMSQLNKNLQGSTKKQKNNNKKYSLAWAAWIIARLGGWKGYSCERPPGPITMKYGLDRFYAIREGWFLAQEQQSV